MRTHVEGMFIFISKTAQVKSFYDAAETSCEVSERAQAPDSTESPVFLSFGNKPSNPLILQPVLHWRRAAHHSVVPTASRTCSTHLTKFWMPLRPSKSLRLAGCLAAIILG